MGARELLIFVLDPCLFQFGVELSIPVNEGVVDATVEAQRR